MAQTSKDLHQAVSLLKESHWTKTFFFSPFSSVQSFSHLWLFATPWTAAARFPCLSPTLGACSNSCPSSWLFHPTISSSVVSFSSCLQSFPSSRSFLLSQFFAWGGQSIGASASVLPMSYSELISFRIDGWISLQSKGFSRVFFNTTV